jgi:replicative DNA helicase
MATLTLEQRGIAETASKHGWVKTTIGGQTGYKYPVWGKDDLIISTVSRFKAIPHLKGKPKYLWLGDTDTKPDFYHLAGFDAAVKKDEGTAYFTGGEPDTLVYAAAGQFNALNMFGEGRIAVLENLIAFLEAAGVEHLIHFPDQDTAGLKLAARLWKLLERNPIHYDPRQLPQELGDKADVECMWVSLNFDVLDFWSVVENAPIYTWDDLTMYTDVRPDDDKQPGLFDGKSIWPPDGFYEAVGKALGVKAYNAKGFSAKPIKCPFHDDSDPSASYNVNSGSLVCHAGCGKKKAIETGELVGVDWRDYLPQKKSTPHPAAPPFVDGIDPVVSEPQADIMAHPRLEWELVALITIYGEDMYLDVANAIKPEMFYEARVQVVWKAITSLSQSSSAISESTLLAELRTTKQLGAAGGEPVVKSFTKAKLPPGGLNGHAQKIADAARRRELLKAGRAIALLADSGQKTLPEIEVEAESVLRGQFDQRVAIWTADKNELLVTHEKETERRLNGGETAGLMTGYTALDSLLYGISPDDLVILAARPAMGKSALLLNILLNVCSSKLDTGVPFYASLEMGKGQNIDRLVSIKAGVNLQRVRSRSMSDKRAGPGLTEWDRYNMAVKWIKSDDCKLFVMNDQPAITLIELETNVKRAIAKHGKLAFIGVDYLQLMSGNPNWGNIKRQQEVGRIADGLKNLARTYQTPVIALSQLNRELERRRDKRPMLSDLRESGAIEQAADVVIGLYRPVMYDQTHWKPQETEAIILKQRNGPPGTALLDFIGEYVRFVNTV